MPKLPRWTAAGLLLALALPVAAAPVRGLFEATVPVADQSVAVREKTLRDALATVLVRVTGARDLPGETESILSRASSLVTGYGYEAAPGGQGLHLRARFDPRAVESALRKAGLPFWGDDRPSHLVWMALRDDGSSRALLDPGAAAARAPGLLSAAESRGVILAFPDMDATDRRMVQFNEVWDGRYEDVVGASRRYAPDQILVVRTGREGGRWQARWALLDSGVVTEEWISVQGSLDAALAAGLHELADREAQRFAVRSLGSRQELLLQVAGVGSLRDYGRVLNYLGGLNPVKSARIERVEPDAITYRLAVEGNPDTLLRVIAAGRVLERRQHTESLFSSTLNYVLAR